MTPSRDFGMIPGRMQVWHNKQLKSRIIARTSPRPIIRLPAWKVVRAGSVRSSGLVCRGCGELTPNFFFFQATKAGSSLSSIRIHPNSPLNLQKV